MPVKPLIQELLTVEPELVMVGRPLDWNKISVGAYFVSSPRIMPVPEEVWKKVNVNRCTVILHRSWIDAEGNGDDNELGLGGDKLDVWHTVRAQVNQEVAPANRMFNPRRFNLVTTASVEALMRHIARQSLL